MMPTPAVFAIPGDHTRKTGGFIYERRLLETLRASGRQIDHLVLPAGFPDATPDEMQAATAQMAAVPADRPIIVDGLVFGAFDPARLATIAAPLVAMIHHPLGLETGLDPARAEDLLYRERANLERAAHVLVPSPHTAQTLADDFGVPADRITVVPPGFPRRMPSTPPPGPPVILSVGLLAARKGHDVLIDALARIADLDWRAEIVGGTHDASVAAALRDRRDRLGLAGRIAFRGTLTGAALDAAFRQATLFALATRYEGYGMAFAEAMTYGLPIVTCRVGAVPDTVGDAAILVDVDDARAFAQALRDLLSDRSERDALASRALAVGRALPDWPQSARIAGAVLDRVAAGRSAAPLGH